VTNKEISEAAEKYRREMMRMYNQSGIRSENQRGENVTPKQAEINANEANENSKQENTVSEVERVTDNANENQKISEEQESEIENERFPEPDISELSEDMEDNVQFNEAQPENNAVGYIQIVARTGLDAFPVSNALVTISYTENGQLIFETSLITDESGKTERVEVPAPSISYSLKPNEGISPYSLYNITIDANGFFRQRSVNVPVFEGVTSLQQFNLVPLPLYMTESDSTTEIYNQEPEL